MPDTGRSHGSSRRGDQCACGDSGVASGHGKGAGEPGIAECTGDDSRAVYRGHLAQSGNGRIGARCQEATAVLPVLHVHDADCQSVIAQSGNIHIITVTAALAWRMLFVCVCCRAGEQVALQVDPRTLVSRADLIYLAPTEHNREGQPIGNGRMGTVVWTTPGAVHFLINRVDQYSADNSHGGQFCGPSDDFGRLARVSIEVGGEPFAPAKEFRPAAVALRRGMHDPRSGRCGALLHLLGARRAGAGD